MDTAFAAMTEPSCQFVVCSSLDIHFLRRHFTVISTEQEKSFLISKKPIQPRTARLRAGSKNGSLTTLALTFFWR